jgi:hypothetical protein
MRPQFAVFFVEDEMGYRAFRGHAELEVDNIRAFAICDDCGALYNHDMLAWQTRWTGPVLVNTGKLVCPTCLSAPNPAFKNVVLPPDPEVVINARPPKS